MVLFAVLIVGFGLAGLLKRSGLPVLVAIPAGLASLSTFAAVHTFSDQGFWAGLLPTGVACGFMLVATGLYNRICRPTLANRKMVYVKPEMALQTPFVLYLSSNGSESFKVDDFQERQSHFNDKFISAKEIATASNITLGTLLSEFSIIPVYQIARDHPEPGPAIIELGQDRQRDFEHIVENAIHIYVVPIYTRILVDQLKVVWAKGRFPDVTFIIPGLFISQNFKEALGLAEMRDVLDDVVRLPKAEIRTHLFRPLGKFGFTVVLSKAALEAYPWIKRDFSRA